MMYICTRLMPAKHERMLCDRAAWACIACLYKTHDATVPPKLRSTCISGPQCLHSNQLRLASFQFSQMPEPTRAHHQALPCMLHGQWLDGSLHVTPHINHTVCHLVRHKLPHGPVCVHQSFNSNMRVSTLPGSCLQGLSCVCDVYCHTRAARNVGGRWNAVIQRATSSSMHVPACKSCPCTSMVVHPDVHAGMYRHGGRYVWCWEPGAKVGDNEGGPHGDLVQRA